MRYGRLALTYNSVVPIAYIITIKMQNLEMSSM